VWRCRSRRSAGRVMRVFLREQPGREDRIVFGTVLERAFIVLENPELARKIQEFIVVEGELLPPWMLVAEMVVDEKGFVDEHPARPECANQQWKERPVEIKKPRTTS